MMRNLLRTPTIDINGKATHVWRSDTKNTVPVRTLPVMSATMSNEDKKVVLLSQKIEVVKCKSRKHGYMGCGELDCPEGTSIKRMTAEVQNNPEKMAEILAVVREPDFDRAWSGNDDMWRSLTIPDKRENPYSAVVNVPLYRPGLRDEVAAIDKSIIPSFDTAQDMEGFVEELYGRGNTRFSFHDRSSTYYVSQTPFYLLADLYVAADLRGLGVGTHIMQMVDKFASEKKGVVTTIPSEAGDGSIYRSNNNQEKWEVNRKQHYKNLVEFYGRYGFDSSPFYASNGKDPEGNSFSDHSDYELYRKLNEEARDALWHGVLARFPDGVPPKSMFRKSKVR